MSDGDDVLKASKHHDLPLFSASRERRARMMDGLAVALLLLAIGIAGCAILVR